jgi:DNA-binding NarL/FixJ family response regulator
MQTQEILSVLVMDEDPLTLKTVEEAVREYYSVVQQCSSPEAVVNTVLHDLPIDVILLDLQKPFEKAFDLLSELRAKAPQTETVFVSKFDDEDLWIEAIQRGAFDMSPKPLELPELRRILLLAAGKHHPVRARGASAS